MPQLACRGKSPIALQGVLLIPRPVLPTSWSRRGTHEPAPPCPLGVLGPSGVVVRRVRLCQAFLSLCFLVCTQVRAGNNLCHKQPRSEGRERRCQERNSAFIKGKYRAGVQYISWIEHRTGGQGCWVRWLILPLNHLSGAQFLHL